MTGINKHTQTQKINLNISVFYSCLTFLTIGILSGCNKEQKLEPNLQAESNRLMAEVEKEIHLTEVSKAFSQQDYPSLYEQWGEEWMQIINTMLPLAAQRVQNQPECDRVANVDLSKTSKVGKSPILNVRCDNNEYFYISLGDITNEKRLYPISMLFGRNQNDYLDKCVEIIQKDLLHPKSLIRDEKNTNIQINKQKKNLEIQFPFTVKTGYKTTVTHNAFCVSDDKLNMKVEFEPKKTTKIAS